MKRVAQVTSGDKIEKKSSRLADLESRNAAELIEKWKKASLHRNLSQLEKSLKQLRIFTIPRKCIGI
jgi:hypothetical protein